MRVKIFLILILSSAIQLYAQKRASEWQLGYLAPYITNIGATIGFAFDINNKEENINKSPNPHHFQVLTQLSYYSQLNVADNVLLNPEIVYKWNKFDKRFFLTSSIGTGYLISLQKQEEVLNLATGEIDYRYNALNYFLPNLNVSLGLDPKKHFGFYMKVTYGRKLSAENANAAFFGFSTGLILKFKSKE